MAIGKVMVTSSLLLLLGVPPPNVGEKRLKGLLMLRTQPCAFLRPAQYNEYTVLLGENGQVWPKGIELSGGPVQPWAIIVNHRP